jgi:hypothetical protein
MPHLNLTRIGDLVMNLNGLQRLLHSSKALVMVFAIIGAVVASLVHGSNVTPQMALDFIKWIVMTFLGATAAEDYAAKRDQPSTVTSEVKAMMAIPLIEDEAVELESRMAAPKTVQIAVINKSARVTDEQVQLMTWACAAQITKHAAPLWDRAPAGMTFYTDSTKVPADAYLIAIIDEPDVPGALGYHTEENAGRIVSYIFVSPVLDNGGVVLYDAHNPQNVSVSSVLSHEALEAFVDPFVNVWADGPVRAEGSSYSMEVADPVEGDSYAIMTHGTLVSVSNFVGPHYFDNGATGKRYDWLNKLRSPFTMTHGGYMVLRHAPGTEKQVFGMAMPEWKRQMKSLRLGHGGMKSH